MTDAERLRRPPAWLSSPAGWWTTSVELDRELGEVDLLVDQAKTEAARHEARQRGRRGQARGAAGDQAGRDATEHARAERPARHADQAGRPDGVPGRRPRRQAPGARALPRCASPSTPRAIADLSRSGRCGRVGDGQRRAPATRSAPLPAGRLAARPDDAGGPAPRDRPGDARRAGPEPDEHRAPGADRRAARGARPGHGAGRGPSADRDGPADPRRDQVVHLRRPPDGPRRPRPGRRRCAAPRGSAGGAPGSRSTSTRWARTGGCRSTSRAACSGSSTTRWRRTSTSAPDHMSLQLDWAGAARGPASPPREPSRRRPRPKRPAAPGSAQEEGAKDEELPPALAAMIEDREARRSRRRRGGAARDDRRPARVDLARDPGPGRVDRRDRAELLDEGSAAACCVTEATRARTHERDAAVRASSSTASSSP